MSKLQRNDFPATISGPTVLREKDQIKITVKDTDFLLKLIIRSQFEGSELEIAHSVMQKLSRIHRGHLES